MVILNLMVTIVRDIATIIDDTVTKVLIIMLIRAIPDPVLWTITSLVVGHFMSLRGWWWLLRWSLAIFTSCLEKSHIKVKTQLLLRASDIN